VEIPSLNINESNVVPNNDFIARENILKTTNKRVFISIRLTFSYGRGQFEAAIEGILSKALMISLDTLNQDSVFLKLI